MGQHWGKEASSRDLTCLCFLSAEGKNSSFRETSAFCWNTVKLPVQVGISHQSAPWKIFWCCAVSEQSENVVAVFIPGNWAAGRWLQLSPNGTLTKLSSFCYSFHVPQFHLIWYFYLSKELWYVSVYVHVHMFLHVWMCKDAHTSIWTGRWNLDDTKNNESSFIDLELTRIQKHQ